MKFTDLDFQPHPNVPGEKSVQALHFFSNGYGVSVVRFPGSYGYENGLYELAVLNGTADNFEICYDTPITEDVLSSLDEETVEDVLNEVSKLTKKQVNDYKNWSNFE